MSQQGKLRQVDLDSLTGDTGGPIFPDGSDNINIVGGGTTVVNGNPGTNTLTINASSSGYPITPFVVGIVGQAGYQTIQAAIDAATLAGGSNVIWIQPGSYTENLNITSSITFMSVDGEATITGIHTPPTTGTVNFDGCVLISATHIINSASAGSTTFNINNSFIIITNGYIFNVPNWTGEILMDNCGEASTNDGGINNVTGSSNIKLINVEIGAGSSNTMQLNGGGGFLRFDTCNVNCPVNMVGSGSVFFQNGVKFANQVTIGGSLTGFAIDTNFRGGVSQALTFNSSGNFSISNGEIQSTNNPSIGGTGSGTLTLTGIAFPDDSNIAGTLTIGNGIIRGGNFISQFVVGLTPDAEFQTIQAAMDAANTAGGGTVYVKPGIYTENLTFYTAVDLWGAVGIADTQTCKIIGVHVPPTTGSFTIRNIFLESATHIFSSVTAGSSTILLIDCAVNVTNGFTFNLPNWTGGFAAFDIGEIQSTNDGWINNTGGAFVFMTNVTIGSGTGQTMVITGGTELYNCVVKCPVDFQTGTTAFISGGCYFQETVTFSNNSTATVANVTFAPTLGSAVTYNSSGATSITSSGVNSSTNPAIAGTGAGTLTLTGISFANDTNIAATLTLDNGIVRGGNFISQFVVGSAPDAKYRTVQAAMDAANTAGGGTVYIKTGIYTENLTFYSLVDLIGVNTTGLSDFVQIVGIHTPPLTGIFSVKDISFKSATHIFNSVAAGSCFILLVDCLIQITAGYTFNLPNWTGGLVGLHILEFFSVNSGWINNTVSSFVFLNFGTVGAGTTQPMILSSTVQFYNTFVSCPVEFQTGSNVTVQGGCRFNETVTFSNNTTADIVNTNFSSSTSSAIIYNSTGSTTLTTCGINSSTNPAIAGTGSGTLTLTDIGFVNNNDIAGTLTIAGGNQYSATYKSDYTNHGVILGQGTISNMVSTAAGTNGQLLIGGTGVDPVFANLTAGTGISIVNGSGTITINSNDGGFTWTEVTGTSQSMAVDNGYIANNAGLVTLTLPTVAVVGDAIKVDGKGLGGWNIAQNAGQTIHFLGQDTTTGAGGSLASTTRYDCVTLRCTTANTDWLVETVVGNITVT